MINADLRELPEGWVWAKLSEIADVIYGQSPPSSTYSEEPNGLPFFQGKTEFTEKHPEVRKYCSAPTRLAQAGDILISIRAPVGPTNVADRQCGIGRGLAAIRRTDALTTGYIRRYIRRTESDLARQGTGTTFKAITKRVLNNHPIAIPPLAEQERIVDKIDELFSAIEAGERAIEQARIGVVRYRKAILKAAVTGELTKDWRDENPPKESAEELLARILTARYEAWEKAELAKLDAKGKAHPETEKQWEKFRGRYKSRLGVKSGQSSSVPKNWTYISLDQICDRITDGTHQAPKKSEKGVPFVVIGNVSVGDINWASVSKFVSNEEFRKHTKHIKPEAGDVLYTAVGSYGMAVLVKDNREFLIQRHIAHLRPNKFVNSSYVQIIMNSPIVKSQADRTARGVAQKTVTLGSISSFTVPLAPQNEQAEIVNRVEQALSKADAVEATLDAQSRAAKALKQAVLKTAFEGKLVPQNPNDEPASELLKRIKEEA